LRGGVGGEVAEGVGGGFLIRRARGGSDSDDSRVLAELGRRTFDETFGAYTPRWDMEIFLIETYSESRLGDEFCDARNAFSVGEVEIGGMVEAACYLKVSVQEDYVPDCVRMLDGERGMMEVEELFEIARLYIDGRFKRRGIGSGMMEVAVREARERGRRRIWLSVCEHNEAAKAFYGEWGFRVTGSHLYPVGNDPQTDLLMVREV